MGRHTISLRLSPHPGGTRSSGFSRRFFDFEGSGVVVEADVGRGESGKTMVMAAAAAAAEGLTLVNSTSGLRRMVEVLAEFA